MFSNFLADRPDLREKLFAGAVFSGIAVGGVSGFNMIITGGFDFLTPGREIVEAAPSSYVTVVPSDWFEQGQLIPMASTEPLFAGEARQVSDDLDGAYDQAPVASHYPAAADDGGDALYRELAARYDNQRGEAAQRVQPAVIRGGTPNDAYLPVANHDEANGTPEGAEASEDRFEDIEAQVLQAVPANMIEETAPPKPAASESATPW